MQKIIPILLSLTFLFSNAVFASKDDTEALITSLSAQIQKAPEGKAKAKLYLYRARHNAQLGKDSEAFKDYQLALGQDYAGWIANEYGYFLYNCGEYAQAHKTAQKVIADFPHMKGEAEKLKEQAGAKLKEEYDKENPPEIVMDVKVDPNRKTRHDLIKKMKPVSTNTSYASISNKSSSTTKKTTTTKKTVKRS